MEGFFWESIDKNNIGAFFCIKMASRLTATLVGQHTGINALINNRVSFWLG